MFKGSMVAMATPMHENGAVDYDTLADYVRISISRMDTDVLVPAGTTGESATLDHAEHCELIRFVVKQARGRVPVIAGTGSNSTQETIELTQCAKDAGADACLLVHSLLQQAPPRRGWSCIMKPLPKRLRFH